MYNDPHNDDGVDDDGARGPHGVDHLLQLTEMKSPSLVAKLIIIARITKSKESISRFASHFMLSFAALSCHDHVIVDKSTQRITVFFFIQAIIYSPFVLIKYPRTVQLTFHYTIPLELFFIH